MCRAAADAAATPPSPAPAHPGVTDVGPLPPWRRHGRGPARPRPGWETRPRPRCSCLPSVQSDLGSWSSPSRRELTPPSAILAWTTSRSASSSQASSVARRITASPHPDPDTPAMTKRRGVVSARPRRTNKSAPTCSTVPAIQARPSSLSASRLVARKYSARAPPTRSAEYTRPEAILRRRASAGRSTSTTWPDRTNSSGTDSTVPAPVSRAANSRADTRLATLTLVNTSTPAASRSAHPSTVSGPRRHAVGELVNDHHLRFDREHASEDQVRQNRDPDMSPDQARTAGGRLVEPLGLGPVVRLDPSHHHVLAGIGPAPSLRQHGVGLAHTRSGTQKGHQSPTVGHETLPSMRVTPRPSSVAIHPLTPGTDGVWVRRTPRPSSHRGAGDGCRSGATIFGVRCAGKSGRRLEDCAYDRFSIPASPVRANDLPGRFSLTGSRVWLAGSSCRSCLPVCPMMIERDNLGGPRGGPAGRDGQRRLPSWRREALRTTFWLVPTILVVVAGLLFAVTFEIDLAAYHRDLTLPFWIRTGSADAGRQVLSAIAAAVITVVGVVFSITILALTLASQQFGPRMMRNFVRDLGNQVTLGVFVGTFVYAVLALGSITGDFVPHLSITVAEALAAGGHRCSHLFHPSHRQVDSATGGDRRHRPRSHALDRCRVPRTRALTFGIGCAERRGEVRTGTAAPDRGEGRCRPCHCQRLSTVRGIRTVGRYRSPHRCRHPP